MGKRLLSCERRAFSAFAALAILFGFSTFPVDAIGAPPSRSEKTISRTQADAEIEAAIRTERRSREAKDLLAQQQMAIWARAMFWATAAQVGLGIVGTLGLGLTVYFSFRAAMDGRVSANAATAAATTAADTAKRQLRAYVGVSSFKAKYDAPTDRILVEVKIKNAGQTPAERLVWRAGIWISAPQTLAVPAINKEGLPVQDMLPGREALMSLSLACASAERLAALKANAEHVYVQAWGRYCDIYGDQHDFTVVAHTVWRGAKIAFRAHSYLTDYTERSKLAPFAA